MKVKTQLTIVFGLTGIIVLGAVIMWVLDAHILTKICFSLLAILSIVMSVQTYKKLHNQPETELFSTRGLLYTVVGLIAFVIILIVILILKWR